MVLFIKWIACLIIMMHPVHASFTNVEYLEAQNEISVSFQLFTQDFELLLFHLYETEVNINNQEDVQKFQDKIGQYFNHHFKLKHDDLDFKLENKGIKTTEEFIWFYYRIPLKEHLPAKVTIQNTILFDLFFDQKNLLIIKSEGNEQGYQFDIRNKEILIAIK
ncbi:MAG: hypothetical protein PWP52_1464 [Bacteroidales bacterium]|nr:hypothetical protein [Bacteroidales bacterium]